jgi:TonB family protein
MRRTLLAIAALSTAQPALGADPIVLKPSTQWTVDFAADNCRLVRVFGEGKNQHYLAFKQYWPGEATGLTIAGPSLKRFRSLDRTAVRFFDTQTPIETKPFKGTVDGFGDAVIYSAMIIDEGEKESSQSEEQGKSGWPQLDTQLGKEARFIEVRQGGRTVRLDTGPLDAAFEVMNQCTMDLLREWGLDPERHRTAQSIARWTNAEVIVRRIQSEYPNDALLRGEQGIMRMRLIVSPEGTVESCTILKATETKELDSPACRSMKNAQFEPARDAAGMPFRSLYATSIVYRIGT